MTDPAATDNPYQLQCAQIHWQDDAFPVADAFDDIYFSGAQGLEESRHVFLHHNQLEARWRALAPAAGPARTFTIGETGFGTGLNFLAAWSLWQQNAPAGWQLHYLSAEKHPLRRDDLRQSLAAWPELAEHAATLLEHYPVPVAGHHCLWLEPGRVCLHLLLGDAADHFEQLAASDRRDLALPNPWRVDAWFLDGFAPAKNPSLWNERLYRAVAGLSASGTTVATFTAVGDVRRGLQQQGFGMRKVAGFGRKRDMLSGHFQQPPVTATAPPRGLNAPWYYHATGAAAEHVAVIGAGLAGAHCAWSLARRGVRVTVIDTAPRVADGASGNPQGMLFTRLSPRAGLLSRFALGSFLYALHHYRALARNAPPGLLDFCGVLQLACGEREHQLLAQLRATFADLPELVRFVDADEASALAGIAVKHPGWLFPAAGWVAPPTLCRLLLDDAAITTRLATPVRALRPTDGGGWDVLDGDDTRLVRADAVVIANSQGARQLAQGHWLPLKAVRGQITRIAADRHSHRLRSVLCHEGYLTPAVDGYHNLGATFDSHDTDTAVRVEDHRRNLDSLQAAVPGLFDGATAESLAGRAALRCASPDYLPLVGPLPDYPRFVDTYTALRKNAHAVIDTPGPCLPGLYLNVAHGSRGLTSAPLCAEILAAAINGEPPPLVRDLLQALHPGRFIIRDLVRNKI